MHYNNFIYSVDVRECNKPKVLHQSARMTFPDIVSGVSQYYILYLLTRRGRVDVGGLCRVGVSWCQRGRTERRLLVVGQMSPLVTPQRQVVRESRHGVL